MRHKPVVVLLMLGALLGCALAAGVGVGSADTGGSATGGLSTGAAREVILRRGDRGPAVKRVQLRLHRKADGSFGRGTERAIMRFQRRKGLEPDGVVGPATRRALHLGPFSRASVYHPRRRFRLPRVLRLIARCESGGDPRAVSKDGRYRGKFQFTRETWERLGGQGDPAEAPERLQDRLAVKLYRAEGVEPWGVCGRAASQS